MATVKDDHPSDCAPKYDHEEREFLDKAALAAMEGLIACPRGIEVLHASVHIENGLQSVRNIAAWSYEQAQAMLAERKRILQNP